LDVVVVEIVWVPAYCAALVDVEPAVASVEAKQWDQVEEVDIFLDHVLFPRRIISTLYLPREGLIAPDELEELCARVAVLGHAHQQRMLPTSRGCS
jgi:hypothetical protein